MLHPVLLTKLELHFCLYLVLKHKLLCISSLFVFCGSLLLGLSNSEQRPFVMECVVVALSVVWIAKTTIQIAMWSTV